MIINTLLCILLCSEIFLIGLSTTEYHLEHYYGKLIYVNKKYITEAKIYNVKPNRTYRAFSTFHCQNIDMTGNSFKLNMHAYYEDQELRDTPLQLDVNLCDALMMNLYGARSILKHGNATTCPIKKGCYALNNFRVEDDVLPPYLPVKKYLVKMKVFYMGESMVEFDWHGEVKKVIRAGASN